MLTIRPGLRPIDAISCSVLVALCLAGALIWPAQALWALAIPVTVGFIAWVRTRPVRLEITESVVRAREGGFRGQPDKQVPRSEITGIHYFPMRISFRGPDQKPIMAIEPNYPVRTMLKVAAELKVPLYDHTRWLELRKVEMGRLVYDPARQWLGPGEQPRPVQDKSS